jgi:hypothetical protein
VYGGVDILLHPVSMSALVGGDWSTGNNPSSH